MPDRRSCFEAILHMMVRHHHHGPRSIIIIYGQSSPSLLIHKGLLYLSEDQHCALSICTISYLSINLSIDLTVIYQSTNQSINLLYQSIHPSVDPSIHPCCFSAGPRCLHWWWRWRRVAGWSRAGHGQWPSPEVVYVWLYVWLYVCMVVELMGWWVGWWQ